MLRWYVRPWKSGPGWNQNLCLVQSIKKMCRNKFILTSWLATHSKALRVPHNTLVAAHRQMCSTRIHICSLWLQVRSCTKMVLRLLRTCLFMCKMPSQGDGAMTRWQKRFPACVTAARQFPQTSASSFLLWCAPTVRFVERFRLLCPLRGLQVCRQTKHRREEIKNALFAIALSSLSQASLPSLLINEGKQGRGGN